ncbi:MAG: hypothetical protein J4A00_02875 [Gammaproteobacteria bacterium]|nr:hypothetical protein [Gammaproteobacteria bacterium]
MVVFLLAALAVMGLVGASVPVAIRLGGREHGVGEEHSPDKQRLLRQLEELDEAQTLEMMDPATHADEKGRLESELAQLLTATEPGDEDSGAVSSARGHSAGFLVMAACLAIGLPIAGAVLYFYLQAPFLGQLADNNGRLPTTAGERAVDLQQIEQMVARLAERLEREPEDGEGWKRLGRSYFVLGRLAESVDAYIQADKRLTDDPDVTMGLEQLAQGANQSDGGKNQSSWWLSLPERVERELGGLAGRLQSDPTDIDGWLRLARWRAAVGEVGSARDAYGKAHDLAPERSDILARYAAASFAENQDPENAATLALYQKLYEVAPDNPDANWYLGLWQFKQGNFNGAIARWQKLMNLIPAKDPARVTVGQALAAAKAANEKAQMPEKGRSTD